MKLSFISVAVVSAALCLAGALHFGNSKCDKVQAQELPAFPSATVVDLPAVRGQASVLLSTVHITADKPAAKRPVVHIGRSTLKLCHYHELVDHHTHSTNISYVKDGKVLICN